MAVETELSVVVASHNEGRNLRSTIDAFRRTIPPGSEIIVVDDGSTDDSSAFLHEGYRGVKLVTPGRRLGASAARNVGGNLASGRYLVFSDAHVDVEASWFEILRSALDLSGAGAVAPAISDMGDRTQKGFGHTWCSPDLDWEWLPRADDVPYVVPFIPAGFVVLQRQLFEQIGGFDPGLLIWGSVGDELSLRLWLLGYECLVVPSVDVAHLFREKTPYRLQWSQVLHNMMRLAVTHLSSARICRLVSHLQSRDEFDSAFAQLLAGNVWKRRALYRGLRVRSDDEFFVRFAITALD